MEESSDQQGNRPAGGNTAIIIAGVLVLYVLSVGPAARFCASRGKSFKMFEVVYAPLEWLHRHTALRQPLEVYVEWWVEH